MHSACDSHHKLSDCSRILPNCHQTESQRRVELRDVSLGHLQLEPDGLPLLLTDIGPRIVARTAALRQQRQRVPSGRERSGASDYTRALA